MLERPLSGKQIAGLILIFMFLSIGILIALAADPIAQQLDYHHFIDSRSLFAIPNFANVFSNLPFLLLGLFALNKIMRNKLVIVNEFKQGYLVSFSGLVLVGLASGYYHLWPGNSTLVWDRVAMAVVFMGLFSVVIAEFLALKIARLLLWPLQILGVVSVIYWWQGELNGQGDLRLYALVQFLPILILPLILICFESQFSHGHAYWWLVLFYLFAKVFEYFDQQAYAVLGFISGHTIKHLIASTGVWLLLWSYGKRVRESG